MTGFARGATTHGSLAAIRPALGTPAPPLAPVFDGRAPIFYAAEIELYQPGATALHFDYGVGSRARGALALLPQALESAGMIRASDLGYRTRGSDPGGVVAYPPVLATAFEIDRRVGLAPGEASTRTYGSIRLANLGQRFDAYVQSRNSDNRAVRVLAGQKAFDPSRGIDVDPPYAALHPFFGGVALPWTLGETELTIPLADPAAWLDRPVQVDLYLGTGYYEGGPELAGKPKPMTRGGSYAYPVTDVPLVAIDPVSLVYQWTDGQGTVQALYEGGAAVFVYDGDVADLYATAGPASGHYRTCNARGCLQLGRKPLYTLSADVTGSFPLTPANTPAAMGLAMLIEDMAMPIGLLDRVSFALADVACPYVAGYYVGTTPVQGSVQLALIFGSINARLVSSRAGLLSCFLLRAIPVGAVAAVSLDVNTLVNVAPAALPSTLDPPPYRYQIGYGTVWQTQTSGLNGAVSAERQQQLANATRYAGAASAAVLTQYRRPTDPAPVETILRRQTDAWTVATAMLALVSGRPGYYTVTAPVEVAAGIDLGTVIRLTWPLANLAAGRLGQIVGDAVRSRDGTVTLLALMA